LGRVSQCTFGGSIAQSVSVMQSTQRLFGRSQMLFDEAFALHPLLVVPQGVRPFGRPPAAPPDPPAPDRRPPAPALFPVAMLPAAPLVPAVAVLPAVPMVPAVAVPVVPAVAVPVVPAVPFPAEPPVPAAAPEVV
jgi:hypothetical protein